MLSPALLALLLVLALLALLPARHLHLAGWSGRAVLAYYLILLALALSAIELRPAARFLVPILLIAYLAPFVTTGDGLRRLIGTRPSGRRRPVDRPPKDVTPPSGLLEPPETNEIAGEIDVASGGDEATASGGRRRSGETTEASGGDGVAEREPPLRTP